jgi:hypothetical protein
MSWEREPELVQDMVVCIAMEDLKEADVINTGVMDHTLTRMALEGKSPHKWQEWVKAHLLACPNKKYWEVVFAEKKPLPEIDGESDVSSN